MTRVPALQLHSFILHYVKGKTGNYENVSFHIKEDSFTVSCMAGPITLSGKIRGEFIEDSLRTSLATQLKIFCFTGDDAELAGNSAPPHTPESCASAAQIVSNFRSNEVAIYSSIVGLPPIYYLETEDRIILTSDLHLLLDVPGLQLYFSIDSIREIATIGYPIGNKTLFEGVRILPAGHSLSINAHGDVKVSRHWSSPPKESSISMAEFLEMQSSAFADSLKKIDFSKSFLSLTAGLDTRTILAGLTSEELRLPAFTMSGANLSLDAKTAGLLAKAYNFSHKVIFLDGDFLSSLPLLCQKACRLSGGLASLAQAHEVYFYSQIDASLKARVSGNLGNQVGRGGAENISLRNAGFTTFKDEIRANTGTGLTHWYAPYLKNGGHLAYDFLMEQEILFSSIGNYCVGNYYATQQSPYADKHLIEISGRRPEAPHSEKEVSLLEMRIKDLRHRFLGESSDRSFQRQFIKRAGGAVAEVPINWGGRAKGGISVGGTVLGIRALADAALASKNISSGPIYRLATLLRIVGLHEYRPYDIWLKGPMRTFMLDLFSSKSTKECDLFDKARLEQSTNSYFNGNTDSSINILLSLDLALAAKEFNARMP